MLPSFFFRNSNLVLWIVILKALTLHVLVLSLHSLNLRTVHTIEHACLRARLVSSGAQ